MYPDWVIGYKLVVSGKMKWNKHTDAHSMVNIKVHTEHLSKSQTETLSYLYTENMAAIWHNSNELFPSSQSMISTSQI